ncbi:MAG: DedA family protein [Planctomycetota bacterium]|nr:DedA family protein [Planctomycetota bacterium]
MIPLALLEGLGELVQGYIERFHYLGAFVVLLLCGIGLPLPEEITLVACGYLLHEGRVEFLPVTLVCSSAILLGDSIPYWFGRIYGMRALQGRWIRRVLHPERFARLEEKFKTHGLWATFLLRFMPGARIAGYFLVGSMKMSFGRFLLIDALGVAVSVPASIWAARYAAGKLAEGGHGGLVKLAILIGVVLALALAGRFLRKRERPPPPPDPAQEPRPDSDGPPRS